MGWGGVIALLVVSVAVVGGVCVVVVAAALLLLLLVVVVLFVRTHLHRKHKNDKKNNLGGLFGSCPDVGDQYQWQCILSSNHGIER